MKYLVKVAACVGGIGLYGLPLAWSAVNAAVPADRNSSVTVLEEVLVSGTIIDQESVFAMIPKSTITAEDIDAISPDTLVDLLRHMPGVQVARQGGQGGHSFVSIRGGDPNFTTVMIDGVKVDDPTNSRGGGYDFVGLDPLMIARIDLYAGSYSSVYGSDALGGAINLTSQPVTDSFTTGGTLELGTEDGHAAAVRLAGPLSESVKAGITAVTRRGGDAVRGDSIERQQFAFKMTNRPTDTTDLNWGVNLFISDADATAFPIASGGDQLALIREVEDRDFEQVLVGGHVAATPLTHWRAHLSGGWTQYKSFYDSPGIAPGALSGVPPTLTDSRYERGNLNFSNTLSLTDELHLGFGAEVIKERGDIDSEIDFGFPVPANFSQTRDTVALFGEAALRLNEGISLLASLRHDDADHIESTNGRIAATWNFPDTGTTTTFIYAEGFKLPSLFALGHSLTGNPDLAPEQSESFSLNIRQSLAPIKTMFTLSLYHNKFYNLVDFDPAIFSHVNRSSARAKGVDIGLNSEISDSLNVTADLGYLSTKVNDGTRLENRPQWKANISLNWKPADAWLVRLNGHYNGEFYDVSVATGEIRLDGYRDVDFTLQYRLTENMKLKLLINNLFDSRYEEVAGFSAPDRQVRLAVTLYSI